MAERLRPPARGLLASEPRAFVELLACCVSLPLLRRAPRGDGHPVLVLPGFIAGDHSTLLLRHFLNGQGFSAHGWNQGRNLGPRPGVEDGLRERLRQLRETSGRKVSLVGWSLGGIYARELARWAPHDVRQVVTLGTPFTGSLTANHAWWLFELASGVRIADMPRHEVARRRRAPPVPTTAFYSRTDGVTAWQCCVERRGPRRENIEVPSSHFGFGHHPLVLWALADRLAQPERAWRPFDPQGLLRHLYNKEPVRSAAAAPVGYSRPLG